MDQSRRKSGRPAALERLEEWLEAPPSAREAALAAARRRIERIDHVIRAWVQVQPRVPMTDGPLAGVPFGVKDVIETEGLATEFGSSIYRGRQGTRDAAIVERLQRTGAVLLGKTRTAAFACRSPAATRNPRHLLHTPGGSSSGSAAAVAAGMVPLTVGTQTHGSVLRPASYCGVTGFKPTYGILPVDGVLPVASSLDTLGLFTHTAVGMQMAWRALGPDRGAASDQDRDYPFGVLEPLHGVEPPMTAAFRRTIALLRKLGIDLQPLAAGPLLDRLFAASRTIEQFEGARVHRQRFERYGDRLLDVADLVRAGLQISNEQYRAAVGCIADGREQMAEQFRRTPVILAPAATGPAPPGLASTGDPRQNSPWTAIGSPAISIPMATSGSLPLGLQLVAVPDDDSRLLAAAVKLAALIAEPYPRRFQ